MHKPGPLCIHERNGESKGRCGRLAGNVARLFHLNQKGVTLLELLLSLVVLGMMLPVLAGLMISLTETWSRETERLEARQQAEIIVRRIEAEVREGKGFAMISKGVSYTNQQGHLIRYTLGTGGLLLRDDNGQGGAVIGADVIACKFTTQANGSLLRMQLSTAVGQAETDLDQQWVGRDSLP